MEAPERYWLVVNVNKGTITGRFPSKEEAMTDARQEAKACLGTFFAVFEPVEAFVASATVDRAYLPHPKRHEAEQPPSPAP